MAACPFGRIGTCNSRLISNWDFLEATRLDANYKRKSPNLRGAAALDRSIQMRSEPDDALGQERQISRGDAMSVMPPTAPRKRTCRDVGVGPIRNILPYNSAIRSPRQCGHLGARLVIYMRHTLAARVPGETAQAAHPMASPATGCCYATITFDGLARQSTPYIDENLELFGKALMQREF
jgi:hypothetical protein